MKAPVPKPFLIKLQTWGLVFSCKFYEISKTTFFLKNTSGGCFCKHLVIVEIFQMQMF